MRAVKKNMIDNSKEKKANIINFKESRCEAVEKSAVNASDKKNNGLCFNKDFLIKSPEFLENDIKNRYNLEELNISFRESVPVLEFVDWKITQVKPGFVETVLPINPNSSNQHITHQAALMLLSADYTGGLALSTLFHGTPIVGFWTMKDSYGAYMWGAKAAIKWHYPSFEDLVCRATIDKSNWAQLSKRFEDHKVVVTTVKIEMFNQDRLVAESDFTYWAQDTVGIMKNAFDEKKINILYEYKTKATARLIAGLRAMEQEKDPKDRMFDDPYAFMLAGKHGITLAKRFCGIIPQIQNMVSARTKHLDDVVREFAKKHKKFNAVNIGSGYDSRFWRLNIENCNVFDLDLPVVLTERKRIFDFSSRKNFHTVPIDLRDYSIDETLLKQEAFDSTLPLLVIWEGGSMYFDDEFMSSILGSISKLLKNSPDSRFWFDYVSKDIIENRTGLKEIEDFMRNMSKMGEPFVNGFANTKNDLASFDIDVLTDDSSDVFLDCSDLIYSHYRFCVAKKI